MSVPTSESIALIGTLYCFYMHIINIVKDLVIQLLYLISCNIKELLFSHGKDKSLDSFNPIKVGLVFLL